MPAAGTRSTAGRSTSLGQHHRDGGTACCSNVPPRRGSSPAAGSTEPTWRLFTYTKGARISRRYSSRRASRSSRTPRRPGLRDEVRSAQRLMLRESPRHRGNLHARYRQRRRPDADRQMLTHGAIVQGAQAPRRSIRGTSQVYQRSITAHTGRPAAKPPHQRHPASGSGDPSRSSGQSWPPGRV